MTCETELKCMLTESEYILLKSIFTRLSAKEQVNYYYSDTQGLLRKNGITFRIRTKDGINRLQLKIHKKSSGALQVCDEYEYPIENIPDGFDSESVKKLTGLDTPVFLLGSLTTLRHSCFYCDGVEICLDKNDYLGITDYEIEIEYTETIPPELLEIFSRNGIVFKSQASGKCSRFMKRLSRTV